MKAIDVAYYVLERNEEKRSKYGDNISNLKLQKLLYYLQGFHLVFFEKPFFSENIEAWQYGPVVPDVYHALKKYGSNGISYKELKKPRVKLKKSQVELIDVILDIYGEYSAIGLMNLTHSEDPWKKTEISDVISHKKLTIFFKTKIKE
ncbi:MAG: DUF4065 domain-containing protein [Bacteroidales bacterium]|nr:DUF4065 domain-containing protein [Bacteroidales bacterium]